MDTIHSDDYPGMTTQHDYMRELERRGQAIVDAMGEYRGTEPLIEAVARLAHDHTKIKNDLVAANQANIVLRNELLNIKRWLNNNTTFMDVDHHAPFPAPNVPVLVAVSKRIWYHATDDQDSWPFSSVIDKAQQ